MEIKDERKSGYVGCFNMWFWFWLFLLLLLDGNKIKEKNRLRSW